MDCLFVQSQLGAMIDGELPADQAAALESHLQSCEACRREQASLVALTAGFAPLAAEAVGVPTSIWAGIEARLDSDRPVEVVGAGAPGGPSLIYRFFHRPLAIAASLALLIGAATSIGILLSSGSRAAQADTIDYRILLDHVGTDADAAVERFLRYYKAERMSREDVFRTATNMSFALPDQLPGDYLFEESYRVTFGRGPGYAARYRRADGEPVFVFFHAPMCKRQTGVHCDSKCALARGSHAVTVGAWRLIHFTDPQTCHCLLSRSTDQQALRSMLAAISPEMDPAATATAQ